MKQKTFKQRQKAPNNFRLTKQQVQITPNFSNKHLLKGGGGSLIGFRPLKDACAY